jgi:uncharacterized protein
MIVGAARIVLLIPENMSLKGKRKVVKSIMQRVRNTFNVSIAETGDNDLWQRAELGISTVGNDASFINSRLDKAINHIEEMNTAEILESEIEIIHL